MHPRECVFENLGGPQDLYSPLYNGQLYIILSPPHSLHSLTRLVGMNQQFPPQFKVKSFHPLPDWGPTVEGQPSALPTFPQAG